MTTGRNVHLSCEVEKKQRALCNRVETMGTKEHIRNVLRHYNNGIMANFFSPSKL